MIIIFVEFIDKLIDYAINYASLNHMVFLCLGNTLIDMQLTIPIVVTQTENTLSDRHVICSSLENNVNASILFGTTAKRKNRFRRMLGPNSE